MASTLLTRVWSILRQVGTLHASNVDFCTCCDGDGRLQRCRAY